MIKKALIKALDIFVSVVFGIGYILALLLGLGALIYVVVWFAEKADFQNLLLTSISDPAFITIEVIIILIGVIWILVTVGNEVRKTHSAWLPKWLKKEK